MTLLTQWFGNDIFTYSSSSLIIDYEYDTTIVSITGEVTLDENNNIHLKEGHTAILSATRFHLSDAVQENLWTIRERVLDENDNLVETIASTSKAVQCILDSSNPRQITLTALNSPIDGYSIIVHSTIGNVDVVVYIDPTEYPTLAIEPTENSVRITEDGDVVMYGGGISDNFAVVIKSATEDAIGIRDIEWNIAEQLNGAMGKDMVDVLSGNKRVKFSFWRRIKNSFDKLLWNLNLAR